jgi:hypothetical protein
MLPETVVGKGPLAKIDGKISKVEEAILIHEQIGRFDVSVDDAELMQRIQTPNHLHEVVPDLGLRD